MITYKNYHFISSLFKMTKYMHRIKWLKCKTIRKSLPISHIKVKKKKEIPNKLFPTNS